MKCSKCGRPAVYHARYTGRYYCKKHFNEMVEKKFKETVKKYRLIEKGERIAVGVSGGKDSVVLMHLLAKLREKFPLRAGCDNHRRGGDSWLQASKRRNSEEEREEARD